MYISYTYHFTGKIYNFFPYIKEYVPMTFIAGRVPIKTHQYEIIPYIDTGTGI